MSQNLTGKTTSQMAEISEQYYQPVTTRKLLQTVELTIEEFELT